MLLHIKVQRYYSTPYHELDLVKDVAKRGITGSLDRARKRKRKELGTPGDWLKDKIGSGNW